MDLLLSTGLLEMVTMQLFLFSWSSIVGVSTITGNSSFPEEMM
jgi:hypothetical protein